MVKKKDLRNMNREDLEKHLRDLKMDMIKAGSQVAAGTTPKNPYQIKQAKKTIARIYTFLKEKEKNQGGKKQA